MTQPKDTSELVARLRAMHSDPIGCGLARQWYVNPDGPEAADELVNAYRIIGEMREALQAAVDDSTGKPNVWFFKAKDALAALNPSREQS